MQPLVSLSLSHLDAYQAAISLPPSCYPPPLSPFLSHSTVAWMDTKASGWEPIKILRLHCSCPQNATILFPVTLCDMLCELFLICCTSIPYLESTYLHFASDIYHWNKDISNTASMSWGAYIKMLSNTYISNFRNCDTWSWIFNKNRVWLIRLKTLFY